MAGAALASVLATTSCSATSADSPVTGSSVPGSEFGISLGSSFDNGDFRRSSTCDDPAHDYSPELKFKPAAGTGSLALTMVDLDNGKVHWIQTGIPGDATGIEEHTLVDGAREWVNDLGEATYDGPCPPTGKRHRYRLTLYALNAPADLGDAANATAAVQRLAGLATNRASAEAGYTGAP